MTSENEVLKQAREWLEVLRAGETPPTGYDTVDEEDKEHSVKVSMRDTIRLRWWLARPNGSLILGRVIFEAVEDRGILVRTRPYKARDVS